MSPKKHSKCSHPKHEEYSKLDEKILYEDENGKLSVLNVDWLKFTYVKSSNGPICLNCVCHEMGKLVEKYPIHD